MNATAVKEVNIGKGWASDVKIVSRKQFFKPVEGSELLETLNYEKFICDNRNRPLSEEKVNFFIKQFKAGKFFMKEFPVIIDSSFVILDGQHRYEAVRRLMMPLYFRFATTLTIENVTDVQINAGWKIEDYIHAFIKQKNQNYIILHRFIQRYKITASVATALLSGNQLSGLKKVGFYEGTFVVKDEDSAHKQASVINELGTIALGLNRDRAFCIAVIKILGHPEYDQKRMIDQLKKYTSLMKRQVTTEGYLRNLEDVFNYRLFTKNKVRFI